MNRVAAKIAEEIGVFFQHHNVNTGARQEKSEHHAGGATAGDAALGDDRKISHRCYVGFRCAICPEAGERTVASVKADSSGRSLLGRERRRVVRLLIRSIAPHSTKPALISLMARSCLQHVLERMMLPQFVELDIFFEAFQ